MIVINNKGRLINSNPYYKMKKITSLVLLLTSIAPMALAIDTSPTEAPVVNVFEALISIMNWLFAILLVTAAIFLIIAGYFFVTAQGEPDKVKTARNFVMYAAIGVLIAFLAKGLVVLVGYIVGETIEVPTGV